MKRFTQVTAYWPSMTIPWKGNSCRLDCALAALTLWIVFWLVYTLDCEMCYTTQVGSNTRFSRLDKFEDRLQDSGQAGKYNSRSQHAIQRNHRRKFAERHDISERRALCLTESVLEQDEF